MVTYKIKKYYQKQNVYRQIIVIAEKELTREEENGLKKVIFNTIDGVTVTRIP